MITTLVALTVLAQPLRLHPDNPRYFEYRGKPMVLVTSGEHYGAVLNSRFDYRRYLDTLQRDGLNLTRIFTGLYREVPGSFNIANNTLAPEAADFLNPLTSGEPYWTRLRDFVDYAAQKGIIVEVCLTTTHYNDTHWKISPLHPIAPHLQHDEVWTLKDAKLQAVVDDVVRRITKELARFDNVYYEICNEPYFGGPTLAWQRHMARVIKESDGGRHLISQNIANHEQTITDADPNVSIFNFHYARPPRAVEQNYGLKRPIGMNETGFDGFDDAVYRIQAWDFLAAGGALYNNLDYSFAVGFENGTYAPPASTPGGGSVALRKQLGFLKRFFDRASLVRMSPQPAAVSAARCLGEPGVEYLCYAHHGELRNDHRPRYTVAVGKRMAEWRIQLPPGEYSATWWDPKTGAELGRATVTMDWTAALRTPEYSEDLALELRRVR